MNILVFSAYYTPEIAASMYLTENILAGMAKDGHHIEMFVPTPTRGISEEVRKDYKRRKKEALHDGHLIVNRMPLYGEGKNSLPRAIRYLLLNVLFVWKSLFVKADVIFVQSTPPTQGMMAGIIKKIKRVPFVYNLQDIFPDSLVSTGLTKKGSLLWKIGRVIEDFTYRNADKIVVISEDFKKNIMAKGVPEDKIAVIYNWVEEDKVFPVSRDENKLFKNFNLLKNNFYISYCGNIGYTQNMDMLLKVAEELQEYSNIMFLVIGEGAYKEQVKAFITEHKVSNVLLFPFQPYEDIAHVFSLGDVSLIISKKDTGHNSIPSKTWSIMSAARPVIASFDEESELCSIIRRSESGLCVPPDDPQALKNAILKLYSDKEKRIKFGKNGREFVLKNLTREAGTAKYVQVVREVFEKSSY